MKKNDHLGTIIILSLVAFDFFIWHQIFFAGPPQEAEFAFLDVGQGDATLLTFPGGAQVLTDAGPSRQILGSLEKTIGRGDRYIDLAVITHPQLDHFNGFNYLLKNYKFGAFLWNGRDADSEEWRALMAEIATRKIPLIAVREGDRVRYGESAIEILSPNNSLLQSAEPNDTSIVSLVSVPLAVSRSAPSLPPAALSGPSARVLLAGDIGWNVENYLAGKFDIWADILKVPHHGSKYSSGEEFLRAVRPKIAVVQTGKNRYGHPTAEALSRLEAAGAKIFRNDRGGTIRIILDGEKLKIFAER